MGISSTLGCGVIGAGLWGEAHAYVFATHPSARLLAVHDTDPKRAHDLAAKFGVRSYSDLDEMLALKDLRAVGVATPDFGHRGPAVAAANAGKHVLLEKPLATSRDDAHAIADAVRRSGVRLMVDFHSRWNPALVHVKRTVQNGELGRVVSAYYRLNDVISVPLQMLSWADRTSILWFLGSHAVDALRWILADEVVQVYSVSNSGVLAAAGVDVPDTHHSILRFSSGAIATLENAWILPTTHPNINDIKLNVLGSTGMIDVDLSNHGAIQRFLRDRYDQPDVFVAPEVHGKRMGFAYEAIRDFVDRLVTDEPFVVDVCDGLRATDVILALHESSSTGLPVSLS